MDYMNKIEMGKGNEINRGGSREVIKFKTKELFLRFEILSEISLDNGLAVILEKLKLKLFVCKNVNYRKEVLPIIKL